MLIYRDHTVMADFGQSNFGQSNFGQSIFGQLCCCVTFLLWCCVVVLCGCGSCWWCGCWFGPPYVGATSISFFFSLLLPPPFRSFSLSLGVFSLNFGCFFEGRDPKMCTFGLSGCRVKPLSPPPSLPRERRKRREREKSAKFWAAHPSGHPNSGPLPFWPPPFGPIPQGPTHFFCVGALTLFAPSHPFVASPPSAPP